MLVFGLHTPLATLEHREERSAAADFHPIHCGLGYDLTLPRSGAFSVP